MNGINVAAQSNNTSTKPHPLLFTKRRMRLTIYWNYCITDMHKASISQNCQVQQRFCKLQLVYLLYGNVCLHVLARTCKAAACSGTHSSDSSEPKCFTPPLHFAKFTFSEILAFIFREGFHAARSLSPLLCFFFLHQYQSIKSKEMKKPRSQSVLQTEYTVLIWVLRVNCLWQLQPIHKTQRFITIFGPCGS